MEKSCLFDTIINKFVKEFIINVQSVVSWPLEVILSVYNVYVIICLL